MLNIIDFGGGVYSVEVDVSEVDPELAHALWSKIRATGIYHPADEYGAGRFELMCLEFFARRWILVNLDRVHWWQITKLSALLDVAIEKFEAEASSHRRAA